MRRTCAARARRFSLVVAHFTPTSSPGCCCRFTAFWIGAACRKCEWRSCCCGGGFLSPFQKCLFGRARCWCLCFFCRPCVHAKKPPSKLRSTNFLLNRHI